MGVVAGIGQVVGAVIARCAAGAVGAGQQTALGAVSTLHHAVGGRERLIGQVRLNLLHIGLPRHNAGAGLGLILGEGVGHVIGRIVAPPHGGDGKSIREIRKTQSKCFGCMRHRESILISAIHQIL